MYLSCIIAKKPPSPQYNPTLFTCFGVYWPVCTCTALFDFGCIGLFYAVPPASNNTVYCTVLFLYCFGCIPVSSKGFIGCTIPCPALYRVHCIAVLYCPVRCILVELSLFAGRIVVLHPFNLSNPFQGGVLQVYFSGLRSPKKKKP